MSPRLALIDRFMLASFHDLRHLYAKLRGVFPALPEWLLGGEFAIRHHARVIL